MIGEVISHYKIMEKLGEGGMGVVYKAEDTKLDRTVALKFLPPDLTSDPDAKERFVLEAKAAAALNHPNICTIHEIDESEGQMFIVMEYVEGESLRDIIRGGDEATSPRGIEDLLRIATQIAEGLQEAHDTGIVHRDIKPANIMVTGKGQVKVMDFGLAKLKGVSKLTMAGSTLGTMQYMSPEQAQGIDVDQRSDIFSFGVVLYELITGHLPFTGEHEAAVLYSIVNEEPEPVSAHRTDLPAGLQQIVDKTLAKGREERYQHTRDLLADLKRERRLLESGEISQTVAVQTEPRSRKKYPRFIIPAALVFALVIVFLIFKPFQVSIGPQKEVAADENTLAILTFENLKDSEDKEKMGEMISELLITDLSESQYMRVVSSQRLYDILKMTGKEGAKVVDKTVASAIARQAKAKYMLLGKILSTEPELMITSQLVDVRSGNVVASQKVAGTGGENIFSLVDILSDEVKKDLALPALAQKGEEKSVADITTHSPQALRLYLEGNELFNKLYMKEAAEKYENALQIDSTFARAYLGLSFCYFQQKDVVRGRTAIEKAVEFSDHVSKKEKMLIDGVHLMFKSELLEAKQVLEKMVNLYPDEKIAHEYLAIAYYIMKDFENAIIEYNTVIELDSLAKDAYNTMAYIYDRMDRYDEAIHSINKYIELAPGEANPYDTRGDIYARHGEINKAVESYKQGLEIKPDFESSIEKLGFMYLYLRDYTTAERYFIQYGKTGGMTAKSISRADLALIPLSQGQYDSALKMLEQSIAADELDKLYFQQIDKYLLAANIYVEKKAFDKALQNGRKSVELIARLYPEAMNAIKFSYGNLLAQVGQLEEAKKIADEVSEELEKKTESEKASWYLLDFMIHYHGGDVDQALQKITEHVARDRTSCTRRFWLARTCLEAEMIREAVREFETLAQCNILSRVKNPIYMSKIPYFLGICYEKTGWSKDALEQYEEFLDIWKDADRGIEEVEDAKSRLAGLKGVSAK